MHKPVMVNEVVELLAIRESGAYIDGTVGEGGHACAMLQRIGDRGWLIGIDRDAEILLKARRKLARWESRCFCEHGNFADLAEIANQRKIESVDGILFDLGMSSFHVDDPDRGFCFMHDGPLDLRMDMTQK